MGQKQWILILGLTFIGGITYASPRATTSDLGWMAGHWTGKSNGTPMEAYYSQPDGGAIIALTKIASSQKVEFFEFEKIIQVGDSLVLQPYPYDQAGVTFQLKEISDDRAVFENPQHDFPTRIIYEKQNSGLLGRIEGMQNGQPVSQEFVFTKANE